MSTQTKEVEKLCRTEMFFKLFSLIDVKEVKAIDENEKDTVAKRVAIAKYLIQVAHDNKLLSSINSTDTFREDIYNLFSDTKKSKKFFSAEKLNDKVSRKKCLEHLKKDVNAKVVLCAMYSDNKSCKALYETK